MNIVVTHVAAADIPHLAAIIEKHLADNPGSKLLTAFSAGGNVALIYQH